MIGARMLPPPPRRISKLAQARRGRICGRAARKLRASSSSRAAPAGMINAALLETSRAQMCPLCALDVLLRITLDRQLACRDGLGDQWALTGLELRATCLLET